jgi:serine/threonine protein kinase
VRLLGEYIDESNLILILELCSRDLGQFIREEYPDGLPLNLIKSIMRDILKGIKYCHMNKVMHRDLKPPNILYTEDGVAKIADFGLSRTFGIPFKYYPQTVVTLYYRAPEILLG